MKKIQSFLVLALILTVAAFGLPVKPAYANGHASWLEHGWGVKVILPSPKVSMDNVLNYQVQPFVDQINQLTTSDYVWINLSAGANGFYYLSPNPTLETFWPGMAPTTRDLFGEVLDAIITQTGKKVIVYFATEGPMMLKHGPDDAPAGGVAAWESFAAANNKTTVEATADYIIKYYSEKYGTKISGWTFDHASVLGYTSWDDTTYDQALNNSNKLIYAAAARAGNANASIAWNDGHPEGVYPRLPVRGGPEEDFTFGHPTPETIQPFNWTGNEQAIADIEQNNYTQGSLKHVAFGMQETWNSGAVIFDQATVNDWTGRTVVAGGAFSWSVALEDLGGGAKGKLETTQFDILKLLNSYIAGLYVKYDNTSGVVSYNGSWTVSSNSSDYMGSVHNSGTAGDYVQLTFNGTGVQVAVRKGPNAGKVDVIVDGVTVLDNYDTYSSSGQFMQVIYTNNNLAPGNHTVKLVATGLKNANSGSTKAMFDYFSIR